MKGFAQIIIGAGFKTIHFFVPGITRSEHQHRDGILFAAPVFQNFQAIPPRKPQIQYRQGINTFITQKFAFDTLMGHIDGVTGFFQIFFEDAD